MALRDYFYYFDGYFDDVQHFATRDFFWAHVRPYQFAALVFFYLFLITRVIPYLMRNREPFVLKWPIFIYNNIMVGINIYFFIEGVKRADWGGEIWNFEYPDASKTTAKQLNDLPVDYLFYWTKYLDWLDTIFFAVRKKQSHISFLHLYHHAMVPIMGYLLLRICPFFPFLYLFGVCNTFVHIVMYSYYALSVWPSIQKYLWWKKYITQLQIGQFAIYVVCAIFFFFKQTNYPVFWLYFGLTQPPFFLWMFYDFYLKAYKKPKNEGKNPELNSNCKVKSP